METLPATQSVPPSDQDRATPRRRRLGPWLLVLVRRVHLYAGLFLLPWVFLYGITGAMFNHQTVLPEVAHRDFAPRILADSPMTDFPTADRLAQSVVDALDAATDNVVVTLADDHGAEFTSDISFEVDAQGKKHVIHIDPVSHASRVLTRDNPKVPAKRLLPGVANVQLRPQPQDAARKSIAQVLQAAEIDQASPPRPVGMTKLNFLADVGGQPARVTYVLKDGHVDVTQYTGQTEMSGRQFLLRLHATHGASPHWNARTAWLVISDALAIAMLAWGVTGVYMWWHIKRTRLVGALVIVLSIATAAGLYVTMQDFYATTTL